MIAVYSDIVFGDRSLYDSALRAQAGYGLTLLTALDLPWVADGLQRDGAQVRVPVDALLRAALQRHVKGYSVVSGQGPARTAAALAAVRGAQHRACTLRTRPRRPRRAGNMCASVVATRIASGTCCPGPAAERPFTTATRRHSASRTSYCSGAGVCGWSRPGVNISPTSTASKR